MKRDPWSRFSFWVRWWYPREEAQEILSDYAEFPDPDLSRPLRIVRDLGLSRGCWSWLAAFCVQAACLLLPAVWLFRSAHHASLTCLLSVLGGILSLIWFQSGEKEKFPSRIIPVLLLELALLCAAGGLLAGLILSPQSFAGFGGRFHWFFVGIGLACAGFALLGLFRARVADRRWRAAYILGLTGLCLCIGVLSLLHSMELFEILWWTPYVRRAVWTCVVGLAFSGVSLC